jgi:hypothetical protein
MKRSFLITLSLAGMIALSLAFTREEPRYKNLKILPKNIGKEQLDSVMHHFSLSLGVRCTFCHVHSDDMKTWDFASDDNKHKLRAREMMKMMQKINNKFFAVSDTKKLNAQLLVTCYTCHHGANDPSTRPPMPPPRPMGGTDSTRRPNNPQRPVGTDSSRRNEADTSRHNQ